MSLVRRQYCINGIVQGVGFRPFVWRLASELECTGSVCNDASGVVVEIQGPPSSIEEFRRRLTEDAPPLSRIANIVCRTVPTQVGESKFLIAPTKQSDRPTTSVSPDVSICDDCLSELCDPANRRFGYPFINCTHCGPRFTIIESLPYDRQRTTMSGFVLCDACQQEYDSPADRRFHAEPNACGDCGPKIWFVDSNAPSWTTDSILDEDRNTESQRERARRVIEIVQSRIAMGHIIAIKGVGGFHLACDAKQLRAVQTLRQRKRRPDKPLAVMVADLETCSQFVNVPADDEKILSSRERPIVLLEKKSSSGWCDALAPGTPFLGVMLAYSPLHQLLLRSGQVWVMTSGNVSDEPIAIDNENAWLRLRGLADGFLMHDRPIHTVCDDSVLRSVDGSVSPIRRSRGFAPLAIPLPGPPLELPVLALGGEIKATACLAVGSHAYLSQHIGDMGNAESLRMMEHVSGHLIDLYQAKPTAIAADLHPGYLSVMWAERLAKSLSIPLLRIQHHHAHAAALMAEREMPPESPMIACVFDGTGYGTDGAIWGGEWLIASQLSFRRFAHLRNIQLPGGDACILRPARSALAYLVRYSIPWESSLSCVRSLSTSENRMLQIQLEKGINCVQSSSMGRLFDAVASLVGIRQEIHYEGQAAVELESVATKAISAAPGALDAYPFRWEKNNVWELHCDQLLQGVIADWKAGADAGIIGAKFHETVTESTLEICLRAREETEINTVGLTGGVFQNMLLTRLVRRALHDHGFQVHTHQIVPPNDAGIALGQAVIARAMKRRRSGS
jgi:hydrogenase maturation protein HypF